MSRILLTQASRHVWSRLTFDVSHKSEMNTTTNNITNTNISADGMSGLFFAIPQDILKFILIGISIIHLIVVIILAIAVKKDSEKRKSIGGEIFLIPPTLWFVITLMSGGYVGAFAYWVIHYSSLRYKNENGG
jgi:hypothetical protein